MKNIYRNTTGHNIFLSISRWVTRPGSEKPEMMKSEYCIPPGTGVDVTLLGLEADDEDTGEVTIPAGVSFRGHRGL